LTYLFYLSGYLSLALLLNQSWISGCVVMFATLYLFRLRPGANLNAKMDHLFRCDGALLSNQDKFQFIKFIRLRWWFIVSFMIVVGFSQPVSEVIAEKIFPENSKKMQNKWFQSVSNDIDPLKEKMVKIQVIKLDEQIENDDLKKGNSGDQEQSLLLSHEWIKAQPAIVR
jgi:hypothetical protein